MIMIPRTWQRFRAAASQQEAGSSSSSSSSSSRNVMFSEEAHRAIAADRVPLVPLTDVVGGVNDSFSTFSWFDFQQIAKMVDQILPFSLLLLIVLIRRHMEYFFVTIGVSAVMFRSNEIVKKHTALKGDQKVSALLALSFMFMLYVLCIYECYGSDDVLFPLAMFPPKATPSFGNAIFIILVNDTMVRQVAMAFKCLLLIYCKNGRRHNFRRQGQILTLVEYTLLLYRAFLPAPVWYRFFFYMDFGSLFSSIITGLYLTFKLTSAVEKVTCLLFALKALSEDEILYGVYATSEQVRAAGDMCAICQEKMHVPILVRCGHMFCEECVSEWFERECTCPVCRTLVVPAHLRTFGDGSTSLFYQFC